MNRREILRSGLLLTLSAPAIGMLLSACADDRDDDDGASETDTDDDEVITSDEDEAEEQDDDTPDDENDLDDSDDERHGGTLEIAVTGDPPTFDLHLSTNNVVHLISGHIYECLYTWNADLDVVPQLAESTEVSDDGLTVDVTLFEGVAFHNGETMTSEDVVASIERWGAVSGLGGSFLEVVDEINIIDDHNIEFQMVDSYGPFQSVLAFILGGCVIYPKSVLDESTTDSLAEVVGTGPYRFVDYAPDQHTHIERFSDYTNRPGDTSGYAGHKPQYLDEIFFRPVPDEASRMAGVQAGEYHYVTELTGDNFDILDADPNVSVTVSDPFRKLAIVCNTREGIMSDQLIRQAAQAALDHAPILQAALGDGFYRLDSSQMMVESPWHTTVGEDLYDQGDPDRAAELLEQAGYDGSPIRLLTSQERAQYFRMAQMVQQQLTDAGFNVELENYDWATVGQRREDPALWDLFTSGFVFRPEPRTITYIQGTEWPGWWDTDEKVDLVEQFERETDFAARYAIWEEIERLFYEEVPLIHIGDEHAIETVAVSVGGFEQALETAQLRAVLTNVWINNGAS